jgi:hypothetical protein
MTPTATEPAPTSASDLGPAVTTDFAPVVGLENLVGGRGAVRGKEPTAPSTPVSTSPPPIAIPMINIARMCDALVSAFADVDRETDEDLQPLVDGTQPLADHYAGSETSVTMLWVLACMSVGAYGLVKYQRYRLAHPKKPKRPDVATASEDVGTTPITTAPSARTTRARVPVAERATPPEDRMTPQ